MKFKTIINTIMIASILTVGIAASTAEYIDVPTEHWAMPVINEAANAGIIYGRDNGTFGLGDTVKRSEFAAMLVRLMKWDKSVSAIPFFLMFNLTSGILRI